MVGGILSCVNGCECLILLSVIYTTTSTLLTLCVPVLINETVSYVMNTKGISFTTVRPCLIGVTILITVATVVR